MKKVLGFSLVIIFIVLLILAWNNRIIMYVNDEYGFSFEYSAKFIEKYNENAIISLRNTSGSIEINAVARKNIEGINRPLDELGEGYVNLQRAADQEATFEILKDETINISNNKARKVRFTIDKDGREVETAVLIPLEDREITVTIRATEKAMNKNEKSIDKIIKSIKVY